MIVNRFKSWKSILVILVVLAAGLGLYRFWQGPVLPAYQVRSAPLIQNVVATGRVISTSRAQVGSEVIGTVVERRVREGDKVQPGDVLIVLRVDDLVAKQNEAQAALEQLQTARRPQAQAALRQAESQLSQASREAKRRRALFDSVSISREVKEQAENQENTARAAAEQARLLVASLAPGESEESILLERLAAAKAMLLKTTLRSQVAGTVLTRNVEPGDLVQPGKTLLEIARAGDTEVQVPLDERNLNVLALGQRATCIADAYPNQRFNAVVNFIAPTVDPQRGTVDIRLKVDPVPDYLRQDMTISVNVETGHREQALAVPNDALSRIQGTDATVMAWRNGRAQRVAVKLGLRGLAMTEITSGLTENEWVLTSSTVREGERVRVAEQDLPGGVTASSGTRKETPVKFN